MNTNEPLTWVQIERNMWRLANAVEIDTLPSMELVRIHFREGTQWQTWYYRPLPMRPSYIKEQP